MVYEEEALWKDLANTENPELSFELKQALYMKHCRNPEKTKQSCEGICCVSAGRISRKSNGKICWQDLMTS